MTCRTRIGPAAYVDWRASDLGMIAEALEDRLLFRLLGSVDGLLVLDVGCGDGAFVAKLADRGATVVGVDPDRQTIGAAARRLGGAGSVPHLAVAEGQHLPFADATFDAVVAKTVLCFVGEGDAVVGEMARVLRPGGRFVIGELGRWSTWAAARRVRACCGSSLWRRGRFRTPRELRRLAGAAGLQVARLQGAIYYPRVAWLARLLAPLDANLGKLTSFGAAFLALSATKR